MSNLINSNGFNNLLTTASTPAAKQSLEAVRSSLINTSLSLFARWRYKKNFCNYNPLGR
ncbi:hypothetical protein ACSVC9_06685 [Clostridium sp. LBM24168]